jgi:hypothetical protein
VKGEEGAEQRVHKKAIFVYLSASLAPTSASDVARGGLKEAKKGLIVGTCWNASTRCSFRKVFLMIHERPWLE